MIKATCFRDVEALVNNTADLLEHTLPAAPAAPVGLLLAGGSTPFPAYAEAAAREVTAAQVTLMFTDERYVPSDDPASNYHQTRTLINGWAVSPDRVLRVETERTLAGAATAYHDALRRFLARGGSIPVGVLGLGDDGHTCSLFRDEDLRAGGDRYAIAVQRPDGRAAVTVTPRLLTRVERLVFLVAGAGKREILDRLMTAPASVVAGRAVAGHRRVEVWTEPEAWPR
jgi:6-phosphogluconolactonase